MPLELIPHTKRRKMTKARAAKIKLARNGICFNCGQQIREGQGWFIEHPESLDQGGSDNDADLWPSHVACKATKDAADASAVAASRTSFAAFVVVLLGALAAALGGSFAVQRRLMVSHRTVNTGRA